MLLILSVYQRIIEKLLVIILKKNMHRVNITEHDILEDLRLEVQLETLEKIKEVYMERTGEISFVKKEES